MAPRLTKNNRVLALIALMAASSFAVGGAVYAFTGAESTALNASTAVLEDLTADAFTLTTAVQAQEGALNDYALSGNSVALRRFETAVSTENEIMARVAAAKDLPHARAAFGLVARSSVEWRLHTATPVISAVLSGNSAGLQRFSALAVNDHQPVEATLDLLRTELGTAATELDHRQAAVAGGTLIGVVIGFGFLLLAFGVALVAVRRFGHALELDARHASVLNRFTEMTSFAADDTEVAAANLTAIARLVAPDASVTHILNRSLDRAVPEAKTGNAIADVLPLHALQRCAGVLRGTMYVTDDLADDLSVHCPIYVKSHGTLACVPLISGESVGAVHLYWARPRALPMAARTAISRITEHAALAIGNQRLLAALYGQASTDPRTGLANTRTFDLAVEEALSARPAQETLSVLMIDVDNFKDFNDRHGHPAGDEALRTFGAVLRSCLRDGDLAARYGGEEFAVFLRGPNHDTGVALTIAERIRARTEGTIIPLGPGITDRITVSIGIASAPDEGRDRVTLLRVADEALYRAKQAGRNRVEASTPALPPPSIARAPGSTARTRKPARASLRS
jgi:diguanylate cyclase (GGDEF)-like protein